MTLVSGVCLKRGVIPFLILLSLFIHVSPAFSEMIEDQCDTAGHLIKTAESGDIDAQLKVAEMYKSGECFDQSHHHALHWYALAAEQGSAEAQFQLGLLFAAGNGVEQSEALAVSLLGKAAKQDHQKALELLRWLTQSAH